MSQNLTINRTSSFEFVKRLAFSLYQKGDYEEAEAVLKETLGQSDSLLVDERIALCILRGMVMRAWNKIEEALKIHQEARPLLDDCADLKLRAKFHNGTAITYWHLRRFDEALEEYTPVRILMEQVGDVEGYAQAGNNIANLLVDAGRPADAHEYLDDAMKVCADPATHSQMLNTRARAYAAEGKRVEAKRAALESVELSIDGDEDRLFYEHLATLLEVRGVPVDFDMLKHAIEAEEIRKALTEAKGSVYRAAPKLNLTCEGLRYKLTNQHRDLLYLRAPQRRSPTKAG